MAKTILNARHLSSNKEIKEKKETQMQSVATLASSIAHEFTNYLTSINFCADFAKGELDKIKGKVKTANYLVSNLQLQIKGIITGKLETKGFRRYSMIKNINEALEQYPFRTGSRGLITIEAEKGKERDFEYWGNPVLINHVLYNLIKNSLRAIENKGKGIITIKLNPGKKINQLVFRDTATGIPKDFLPKIFKLFESQSTTQGGTGAGLAFCKLIMQAYGGNITCNSVEKEYTEFVLEFPVCLDKLT